MKNITNIMLLLALIMGCKSSKNEIKNPFGSSRYQTNNRYFRASASAQSTDLETARSKAQLAAKQRLAAAIQTQIKNVAENYTGERNIDGNIADFNNRYQQLTREVTDVLLLDVKLMDEKIFKNNDNTYTAIVALEARKKTIYRNFKEQAKARNTLSNADKELIEKMIDKAIAETGDKD